jgi:RNA polymerase sigma-70 factor (ECF subfamily)
VAVQRAGLRLAFVAALQLLPPRQRATLVLCEVLRLSAADAADLLDTSVPSVTSSLQRARATLRAAGPVLDDLHESTDPTERHVIDQYVSAFEAADVPRLTELLAADVTLEMPPVNLWLRGRSHYGEFMDRVFDMRGPGWRLVPVAANGSTALAAYAPDPDGSGVRRHSLQTFVVADGRIRSSISFVDPTLFGHFDLD